MLKSLTIMHMISGPKLLIFEDRMILVITETSENIVIPDEAQRRSGIHAFNASGFRHTPE